MNPVLIRTLLIGVFILFLHQGIRAQTQSTPVEIENADVLTIENSDSGSVRILTGNVQFRQDTLTLRCDSARHYPEYNFLQAFSNVIIQITDTTQLRGNYLAYDGNLRIAEMYHKVKLKDGNTLLETERLTYYRDNGIALYPLPGKLTDADNVLTSLSGTYHTQDNIVYFKREVKLVNPEFRLETDTLGYLTTTRTAMFVAPTVIYMDNDTLNTTLGEYFTQQRKALLYNRSSIRDSDYYLTADTLWYSEKTGLGEAIGNVFLCKRDSTLNLTGDCAQIDRLQNTTLVYEDPVVVQKIEKDTLHLFAHQFKALQDTVANKSWLCAWPHVKIFMKDLQGVCDSLVYQVEDSLLTLYQAPVLWSSENQITGDTIRIWLKNKEMDSLRIYASCFLISQADSAGYNQVKGRQMYGKFKDNALHKLKVNGNAESIYFSKNEEKNTYEGVNKSLSNEILIYFEEQKPKKISFLSKPDGSFIPYYEVYENPPLLEDFNWQPERRPVLIK